MNSKRANLENYLKQVPLRQLFKELGASNPETLAKTVEHFTTKEAEKRDKIVIDYFGEKGVNRIVNTISQLLLTEPTLRTNAKILDVGAGTGFLTIRIAAKIHAKLPKASFYAMDLTPAMLVSLVKKNTEIMPFIGLAENIQGSIKEAQKRFSIPPKFDAIFSTLMLHHSPDPQQVFKSIKTVLKKNGKAIVVDLCEHEFEEFKTEMGDLHLGFKPENVLEMAEKHFSTVKVKKMAGICCKSSGRSAEIFIASMRNF